MLAGAAASAWDGTRSTPGPARRSSLPPAFSLTAHPTPPSPRTLARACRTGRATTTRWTRRCPSKWGSRPPSATTPPSPGAAGDWLERSPPQRAQRSSRRVEPPPAIVAPHSRLFALPVQLIRSQSQPVCYLVPSTVAALLPLFKLRFTCGESSTECKCLFTGEAGQRTHEAGNRCMHCSRSCTISAAAPSSRLPFRRRRSSSSHGRRKARQAGVLALQAGRHAGQARLLLAQKLTRLAQQRL